jgi:hypothetical protein
LALQIASTLSRISGGDPGIDPVSDDVIELAVGSIDARDVRLPKFDVGQGRVQRWSCCLGDLPFGKVDADEARIGDRDGHRYQVVAGRASKLEHPARLDGGRDQGEQSRDRREPRRMRLRIGPADVRQFIVFVRVELGTFGLPANEFCVRIGQPGRAGQAARDRCLPPGAAILIRQQVKSREPARRPSSCRTIVAHADRVLPSPQARAGFRSRPRNSCSCSRA